jgi:hypothetical protein
MSTTNNTFDSQLVDNNKLHLIDSSRANFQCQQSKRQRKKSHVLTILHTNYYSNHYRLAHELFDNLQQMDASGPTLQHATLESLQGPMVSEGQPQRWAIIPNNRQASCLGRSTPIYHQLCRANEGLAHKLAISCDHCLCRSLQQAKLHAPS